MDEKERPFYSNTDEQQGDAAISVEADAPQQAEAASEADGAGPRDMTASLPDPAGERHAPIEFDEIVSTDGSDPDMA